MLYVCIWGVFGPDVVIQIFEVFFQFCNHPTVEERGQVTCILAFFCVHLPVLLCFFIIMQWVRLAPVL